MIETYVTVHDSELLIECEHSGQFDNVSHTYIFVGPRPVDLSGLKRGVFKIIVASDYIPNFEHLPAFYDFTGWWVLAKYGLIEADQVILIQYDMEIAHPLIAELCAHRLLERPGPIAFTAGHNAANNFMLLIPGFERTYRIGMDLVGIDQDSWPEFNEWPSTQGTAWRTDEFVDFMLWFEPLFAHWADDLWAGHLAERSVKAWTMNTGDPERYLPGVINHLHSDCHGTCSLMNGQADVHAERAATFGVG